MSINFNNIGLYRIIPIGNLEEDLNNGLFSKLNAPVNNNRDVIGNSEIISERDNRIVKCYPQTVVNNYVPFYFSVRTPMLYNIITGHGVPERKQHDIVYLITSVGEIVNNNFQWCFTDGNAAKIITKFYDDLKHLMKLDWKSIRTTDFRIDNADGDEDRLRKKHSEFLVKDHLPSDHILSIVVFNKSAQKKAEQIVDKFGMTIDVKINPEKKYYFNGIS